MTLKVILIKTNPEHTQVELFTDLREMTDRYETLVGEGEIVEITSAEI